MGKLLSLILGIAVLAYVGYRSMYGHTAGSVEDATPKERLDNVKNAAKRIEANDEKRVNEVFEKTSE